ncbi:metallophosphoesterase [bacterium]|nr:metallophosphoesterase [bacterium]
MFFLIYNVIVCSLPRMWIKGWIKRAGMGFCLVLPLVLVIFHGEPWLRPVLTLERFHWIHGALVGVLGVAAVGQALITFRLCRCPRVAAIRSNHTWRAPFQAALRDFDVLRDRKFIRQPRAGTVPEADAEPVPHYRHQILPVKSHTGKLRLTLSPPLKWINQAYDLRVHHFVLALPQLPPAFDGLKVLHLTDGHYGEVLSPKFHRHVLEQGMALEPDLIALTGDFVAGDHLYRQAIDALKELKAPLGVWAVRGNHDFYSEPQIVKYWLEQAGIQVLTNRHVDLERDGQVFRLVGIEHPYVRLRDWTPAVGEPVAPGSPFRLVLAHTPDVVYRLSRLGADLVMCGHTHGGQFRLPLIGPVVYPSLYGRRFDRGFRQIGPTLLYASNGYGLHTFPLRLNCPPEVTLFELRRGSQT